MRHKLPVERVSDTLRLNTGGDPEMYEMIVAMNVVDPERYASYREAMRPILERYGGGFRYDLVVSETLRSESSHPITRVFAIHFRDRNACAAFFADSNYLDVKAQRYEGAVDGHTVLAEHDFD